MRKIALILLIIFALGTVMLEAQTTGRLIVRVRDNNGKALEFVNVVIMRGTQRITGVQTDARGTGLIINIPPGTYTVRFSLVGHDEYIVNDVRINVDSATTLNATLRKTGTVLGTTTVTAQKQVVDSSQSGSTRTINVSEMEAAAVSSIEDIVSLQAGVQVVGGELHIRGGRANEVNFTIDGMSVSDPVDGGSALSIDTDAISDIKVMTGGFSAEFGNAQSGVINIVTRDGDPFYSGRIEYQTDHLIGEGRNSDVFKFSIGGPVLGYMFGDMRERFTFFLNGGGEWLDGRLKDYYIGNPNEDFVLNGVQLLEFEYPGYNPYSERSSIGWVDTGNRNYNSYNLNFKSKYIISPAQKVTFAARGDRSYNLPYSYSWRYALQHFLYDKTEMRQYIGTYDYIFSPVMNVKFKASYFEKFSNSGPRGIDRS
ncbi:MAG: TonB-dependent receptor, partial [Candidatus Cloacimonadaceae bacterium]|nr:TonB-dependent receptor [Candidatus Cloacimonadaceae bacterium]